MKRVLLIGDSIRLNYQKKLSELLDGKAIVTGPEDNCRFSSYTLFNVSNWVCDSNFDVIQWNNGQWDTSYMADGKIHTSLDDYINFQKRIARILLAKTKRLIFATTTPVWPEFFFSGSIHPRKNEDISSYNSSAINLFSQLNVEINDYYSSICNDIKRYVCDDMVHLTDEGRDLCAKQAADLFMAS